MSRKVGLGTLLLSMLLLACQSSQEEISFNRDIRPIFNAKCLKCHGGVKAQGGLSLLFEADALRPAESGAVAIVPGNHRKSALYQRLVHVDPEQRMPLDEPALSEEEIKLIADWIDAGAPWENHWAYIPPDSNITVPDLSSQWGYNEIDAFIAEGHQRHELEPSPQASPEDLVRRLYLDLLGLPPVFEDVKWFLEQPTREHYASLVDQLLMSPHFGEHWAIMWLDLARYADSKGYEKDSNRNIWKFRDYVINALNQDKPFDQFTIEQLAGDLLPDPTPEQLLATAFHRNSVSNDEGGTDDEEFRVASVIERVGNTYETWMSTTFACVQCHGHPYDPFRHTDFYQSMALFNNTQDADLYNEKPRLFTYEGAAKDSVVELLTWLNSRLPAELRIDTGIALYDQRQRLMDRIGYRMVEAEDFDKTSDLIELLSPHLDMVWQIQDSSWIVHHQVDLTGVKQVQLRCATSLQLGGYISLHLDSLTAPAWAKVPITRTGDWPSWQWSRPPESAFGEFTANLDEVEGSHDVYFRFWVGDTYIQHLFHFDRLTWVEEDMPGKYGPEFARKLEQLFAVRANATPIFRELPSGKNRTTHFFERGSWLSPGDPMQPGLPEVWQDTTSPVHNRLDFAKWLVNDQHPLTGRVIVNRVWAQLFGQGLVETMEEFGTQGAPPSHPELLDWLAVELRNTYGWSLKQLIRKLVLSDTYRQSSLVDTIKLEVDPQNRWYARGSRVRLAAEQIRDQVLAISGLLDSTVGGPSVIPPALDMSERVMPAWAIRGETARHRRSLYTFWRRSDPYPTMITFDSPDRMVCTSQRIPTNTPLQALSMLNDTTFFEAARHMAHQRYARYEQPVAMINDAYQHLYLLSPSPQKKEIFLELYDQAKRSAPQARSVSYSNKREHDLIDPFATAMVLSAMMNLDAFIVKP